MGPTEICALLGPNGAGKTTLLRILAGMTSPSSGAFFLWGRPADAGRFPRERIGLVPSSDRSFYFRLSGLQNLIFFARLYGLTSRRAADRAKEQLKAVGLAEAADRPVGLYSHGMQKRLAIARALLPAPQLLLIDEATHDLDPLGADEVRSLTRRAAQAGSAVVWATQRVDEVRGFADQVILLNAGEVRFRGSVGQLMAHSPARRYLIRVRNAGTGGPPRTAAIRQAVNGMADVLPVKGDDEHFTLLLSAGTILGDALSALTAARIEVHACQEERPEVETAFLRLIAGGRETA